MGARVGAWALVAATALAAAACSGDRGARIDVAAELSATTTVPGPDAPVVTGGAGATGADGGAPAAAAGGSTGAVTPGAGDRPITGGGASGGTGGTTSGEAGTPPTRAPAGPTTPVRVGIHFSAELGAAYTALGASNAEGDILPHLEALVAWINRTGGLGGRAIAPVYHGTNPLDGSFDGQAQEACADFTEDNDVAVVVSGAVLPTFTLPECLAQRRTPLLWNYQYLLDRTILDRYAAYLYQPMGISAERLAPVLVDELRAAGWFQGAKVAIVRYDLPQHQRFSERMLAPRLRDAGVTVAAEVALRPPPTAAAAGDTASQISSAILRFRSVGVTHVLFVPTGGAVPFLFMSSAESQGFRPRYGLTSFDIPMFVNDQAPASQLSGAVAVGWTPSSDVYEPDEPADPERAQCYRVADSRLAVRFCDGLLLLRAAMARDARADAASLRAAIESLGTSFRPAMTFATAFGPGRHDGASAVRLIRFDDSCECFRYAPGSPVRSIG